MLQIVNVCTDEMVRKTRVGNRCYQDADANYHSVLFHHDLQGGLMIAFGFWAE